MRWDWYAATVPLHADRFLPALAGAADLADLAPSRPMHGYQSAAELRRGDNVLVRALWGGSNGRHVHAWSTGEHAEWFAGQVRQLAPQHRVTRADAAGDYKSAGAWDLLSQAALAVADEFRVSVRHVGDFHRAEDGRTLYIGSRQSAVQLVLYEKGKQLGGDPHWVRCEARVKPQGVSREWAAAATPWEVWGCARWLQAFAKRLSSDEVARVAIGTVYRPGDDARAFAAMCRQYGKLLTRKAGEVGGWPQLGDRLQAEIMGAAAPNSVTH